MTQLDGVMAEGDRLLNVLPIKADIPVWCEILISLETSISGSFLKVLKWDQLIIASRPRVIQDEFQVTMLELKSVENDSWLTQSPEDRDSSWTRRRFTSSKTLINSPILLLGKPWNKLFCYFKWHYNMYSEIFQNS